MSDKIDWFVDLLKQRRVWAAALSAVAVVCAVFGQVLAVEMITGLAGALALHSYVRPKD